MTEKRFYPYKFAVDALAIHLDALTLDGHMVSLDEVYNAESAHVGLASRALGSLLKLTISVTDDSDELPSVVSGGASDGDVGIVLRSLDESTRLRRVDSCTRGSDGSWRADIEIPTASVGDRLEIQPIAVRLTDRVSIGFAMRRGEMVADGVPLVIEFEQRPSLPGNAMDAEWVDFGSSSSSEELQERKDLAWAVDLTDSERPKLRLNAGLAGFRQVLEIPATSGRAARVRNSLTASVLQPVLLTLAIEAIAAHSGSESAADMRGWRKDLLDTLAKHSGSRTEELEIARWVELWKSGNRAVLHFALATAVQRHLKVGESVGGLVRAFNEDIDA